MSYLASSKMSLEACYELILQLIPLRHTLNKDGLQTLKASLVTLILTDSIPDQGVSCDRHTACATSI